MEWAKTWTARALDFGAAEARPFTRLTSGAEAAASLSATIDRRRRLGSSETASAWNPSTA